MTPRLFHFSEDPGIGVFVPRTPDHRPDVPPLVWPVDHERAWTYLFPRDCPRVLLWPTAETPRSVEPVGDMVAALASESVELRLVPSPAPLYGAWEHSFHFSGIRLSNSIGWPAP